MKNTGKIFVILLVIIVEIHTSDLIPTSHYFHRSCKSNGDKFSAIYLSENWDCPCVPESIRFRCTGKVHSIQNDKFSALSEAYARDCREAKLSSFNASFETSNCDCSSLQAAFQCEGRYKHTIILTDYPF